MADDQTDIGWWPGRSCCHRRSGSRISPVAGRTLTFILNESHRIFHADAYLGI